MFLHIIKLKNATEKQFESFELFLFLLGVTKLSQGFL